MLLLPSAKAVTGTSTEAPLNNAPVAGSRPAASSAVPRTVPVVASVNVRLPVGGGARDTVSGRIVPITRSFPESIELTFVLTEATVDAFCTVIVTGADVLGL
jgi:hypothetical protein